jgi:hypothetical protein
MVMASSRKLSTINGIVASSMWKCWLLLTADWRRLLAFYASKLYQKKWYQWEAWKYKWKLTEND